MFVGACVGGQATAGGFSVSPVSVELNAQRATSVLTLTNTDDEPMTVQLRMFAWSQVNGEDQLTPTRTVVASPPAVTLAPGAHQVVRIVHLEAGRAGAEPVEQSYRVLVDELPDVSRRGPGEVAMVLRQSIPVFFTGAKAQPQVTWSLHQEPAGLRLVANNSGGRRMRLSNLELKTADGSVAHARPGLAGYVLSGAEMRWPIELKQQNAAEALSLSAMTDLGPIRAALPKPPSP
jgi:fimbrial chaperone protein